MIMASNITHLASKASLQMSHTWRRFSATKPIFPFAELAYLVLFLHAIGLNYFVYGLHFIFIPDERLIRDFTQPDDREIVWWAWLIGFGLFLLASSFQLVRVYLRVILSDEIDRRHSAFNQECAHFPYHRLWLALHYLLRLAAILLLLFIEKALHTPADVDHELPMAFFQRWSQLLAIFYSLLITYSVVVSGFRLSWAYKIVKTASLRIGHPWDKPKESDPDVVVQAREAFWQSIGWFLTDVILLADYLLMVRISTPDMTALTVIAVLLLCSLLSIGVFIMEFVGPLIEDAKMVFGQYSFRKTTAALMLAFGAWLCVEEWFSLLIH